jgi:hypothetical protein
MSNDELQLSDDGEFWWDGEEWQPVRAALEQIGDHSTSDAVGADSLGVLATYFEPDYDSVEDDASNAEVGETV